MDTMLKRSQSIRPSKELHQTQVFSTKSGQVFQLTGRGKVFEVVGLQGKLWVTNEGDQIDYVLREGEKVTLTNRGKVLIESFDEGKFKLTQF